jgi:hypothetical protein
LTGSEYIAKNCEAGSMFKNNETYYLLTDYTCCFCTQGSGARVYTAKDPLGPYSLTNNINRYPGTYAPVLNDDATQDNQYVDLNKENNTIEVAFTGSKKFTSLQIHQFTGDRKGQCGDVSNPKVHEPILDGNFQLKYFKDGTWKDLTVNKKTSSKAAMSTIYQFNFDETHTDKILITALCKTDAEILHLAELIFNKKSSDFKAYLKSNSGKPIIPAQQAYVMQVKTKTGPQFIWMGDLWGSALDNIKGHDFQYWSAPLTFYKNGWIKPLEWTSQWDLNTTE